MPEDRVSRDVPGKSPISFKPTPMPGRSPWRFQMRHMVYFVFYSAIVCWLAILVATPVVVAILILLSGGLVGMAIFIAKRRSKYQDYLIQMLAIAADRDMSIASAFRAFADNTNRSMARSLLAAADELDLGTPIPRVLDKYPKILSSELGLMARMGWWSGKLGASLREAAEARQAFRPIWSSILGRMEYLTFILMATELVTCFLMYYIMPKFEAIFMDFGLTLPPVTIWVIRGSYFVVTHAYVAVIILIGQAFLLLYLRGIALGTNELEIPLIDRLFVRRHTALILRGLASGFDSGQSLPASLGALHDWYQTAWVRKRLGRVQLDVKHGLDWIASLASHGLLRSVDAVLLESAQRVGNLPWALRTIAAMGERRLTYRVHLFLQTVYFIVVLLVGALVGLICVAYFLPLVNMIARLAG